MQARTFYRGLFWTLGGIALAGLAVAGLALWLLIAPRAFIAVENTTSEPVHVVLLSYRDRVLLREAELEYIRSFSFLRAANEADIVLVIERPHVASLERHVFRARHVGYGNCVFDVFVLESGVDATECRWFD